MSCRITSRPVSLALSIAALALIGPASSAGAPAALPATLFSKPFVYKGYSWTVIATDGQAGKDSLVVLASKKVGGSTQTHTYSFSSGVSFTPSATLASAKLVAKLGRYGTINATFTGKGGLATTSAPRPCTGPKFQSRAGTLARFAFVADTTFFRKVGKASLAASLSRQKGAGKLNCGGGSSGVPPKPTPGGVSLSGTATGGGEFVTLSATKTASGAVTQSVTVVEGAGTVATVGVFHSIVASASASSFTVAPDLASATVTGKGAFLSGALSFSGTGAGNVAAGTLTGNYTAKFDSIGAKTPAAGGDLQGVLTKS